MRNPDFVFCPDHGKRGYHSKKAAKRARRMHHPGQQMDEFPCEFRPGLWHLGHLPDPIKQGDIPRQVLPTWRRPRGHTQKGTN